MGLYIMKKKVTRITVEIKTVLLEGKCSRIKDIRYD